MCVYMYEYGYIYVYICVGIHVFSQLLVSVCIRVP